ncbi:MAG: hypothetical protein QOK37_710 [Thermoanaerobaculia bacterium]|jgi:hypothetical protein|nr:hypothetical protein [Thermoanaerobaculia bacterium]
MKASAALSMLVCVAFIAIAPRFVSQNAVAVLWVEIAALTALMITVGVSVTGRTFGILINERNVMSLSRFQAVLWTVLVLADFATILLGRAWKGMPITDVQDLLRPDLLALMGISYASAVGTSIAHANKSGKPTPVTAVQDTQTNLNDQAGSFTAAQGVMYMNKNITDASVADLFEGDELADAHTTDLSKVQMFFFTVVSAVVFLGAANSLLMNMTSIAGVTIPQLPQMLIALMGISHASYVGNTAVTRTQPQGNVQSTAQPQAQPPAGQTLLNPTGPSVSSKIVQP